MDLSIPVVDSEADDHWRSVPRNTSHQNIKSFAMSADDEDIFPHEEDDIDLSIMVQNTGGFGTHPQGERRKEGVRIFYVALWVIS